MTSDMDITLLFDILQSIAMMVLTYWMWISDRRAARKEETDTQFATLTQRLTVAEQQIANAPDHDDLSRIYARMEEMSTKLSTIAGEFSGLNRTLSLLHEHLLRSK